MTTQPPPQLPAEHRALVLTSRTAPLAVQRRATPRPAPGAAVVRVRAASVLPYAGAVYGGGRAYPFPEPFVPGASCIGEIAALGPDATALAVGDVVLVDMFFRARDDPEVRLLPGLHDGDSRGGRALMEGELRDWTYAEYARVPLETVTRLGAVAARFEVPALAHLATLLVPFGGLLALDVVPGDRVIVAPATGFFGGAAVEVALAMGVQVVAAGRNATALDDMARRLDNPRLITVQLLGDVDKDAEALGAADAYIDISPPAAAASTHIKSCLMAMKTYGRVVFWGGILGDIALPYGLVRRRSLQIRGQWMYDRNAPRRLVKLVEAGLLGLDQVRTVGSFELEQWREAFDTAAANSRWPSQVLLTP